MANWLAGFASDLHRVAEFFQENSGRASVDAMELRLPEAIGGDMQFDALQAAVADCQIMAGVEIPMIFFEIPPPGGAVVIHDKTAFKLRTGGLEPDDFPILEQVAAMIVACRDAGASWKATAGLHHPLRHDNETVGTKMHGFLNLFTAAVLADVHRLDECNIVDILSDELIDNFTFDDAGLRWRDCAASVEQIIQARRRGLISFGSCSFSEPCDDLRALELL